MMPPIKFHVVRFRMQHLFSVVFHFNLNQISLLNYVMCSV